MEKKSKKLEEIKKMFLDEEKIDEQEIEKNKF